MSDGLLTRGAAVQDGEGNPGQTCAQWMSHLRSWTKRQLPQLVTCFTFCEFDEVQSAGALLFDQNLCALGTHSL